MASAALYPIAMSDPQSILWKIAELSKELGTEQDHAVMDKVEYLYSKLSPADRERFDHFIWLAAKMPNPEEFDPQALIGFDKSIILKAVFYLRAWNKLASRINNFQTAAQSYTSQKLKTLFFDKLTLSYQDSGKEAQLCWMDACSVLHGGMQKETINPNEVYNESIGKSILVTLEACDRLVRNHLSLLPSHKDRIAIAGFYETGDVCFYEELKASSPEAARLLATAVGNRVGCPGDGERFILAASCSADVEMIFDCTRRICLFEWGRA